MQEIPVNDLSGKTIVWAHKNIKYYRCFLWNLKTMVNHNENYVYNWAEWAKILKMFNFKVPYLKFF